MAGKDSEGSWSEGRRPFINVKNSSELCNMLPIRFGSFILALLLLRVSDTSGGDTALELKRSNCLYKLRVSSREIPLKSVMDSHSHV